MRELLAVLAVLDIVVVTGAIVTRREGGAGTAWTAALIAVNTALGVATLVWMAVSG
ncbi:hypothetical protein CFP65_1692 [Kitasatospora sp. MMS16-BH015]|uniref:hypothetical protein n=1 Tax=Kitasatospora sp. MMS16-BH015 TaxID=2018025 RepID=UPI000CA12E92|nr:hypothetical protein [Kitasatospora sp. MMS16-BH015]AUG76574.1 hypothetical protein CFP65_1692 [Kitasatospora sp. MMS16-BH015]